MLRTKRMRPALPLVAGLALGLPAVNAATSAQAGERAITPFALTDTMKNATDKTEGDARSLASVVLDGDKLTVTLKGSGFTPNMPHAQHFHGSFEGSKEFTCPSAKADKDGDGQVNTEEGLPDYGDIVISLTTKGDTSAKSGLAVERMPKADADGNLSYKRTINLPKGAAERLQNLHIVQHGLDVNGNDKYDAKALGESTFAKSKGVKDVPEEATNPVTCGVVSDVEPAEAELAPEQAPEGGPGPMPGDRSPGMHH